MNRKLVKGIAFAIAAAMIITSMSFVVFAPAVFGAEKSSINTEDTTIYLNHRVDLLKGYLEYIKKNYKDEISYKVLIDAAMKGATEALGDPYSEYYSGQEAVEEFKESFTKKYAGVGVTITKKDNGTMVQEVNPFGPAYEAGIKEKDYIYKIDGTDVSSKPLDEVSSRLRGEEGTKIRITVKREGKEIDFDITRKVVVAMSISTELLENNVGYMKLSSFDSNIGKEFAYGVKSLQDKGAKSLILDMRNNGGGYIYGAIQIAEQVLPANKIVTKYTTQGKTAATERTKDENAIDLPIVILVNNKSASATELLAAALRENDAAKIVGTNTYGKGVAQQLVNIGKDDSAKISTFYFETPTGKAIQKVGIAPDYYVENGTKGSKETQEIYDNFAPMTENAKWRKGATGLNIYGAQQRLKLLGYYDGKATGTMDDKTVEAIMRF